MERFDEKYKHLMGKQFMAADGGNYGIYVVGCLPEKDDLIVMTVVDGKVQYDKHPHRIDLFKASYRYILED